MVTGRALAAYEHDYSEFGSDGRLEQRVCLKRTRYGVQVLPGSKSVQSILSATLDLSVHIPKSNITDVFLRWNMNGWQAVIWVFPGTTDI